MNSLQRNVGILFSDPRYFLNMSVVKGRTLFPLDYFFLRNGRALPPVHLTLEVTHRCNLACHMCDLYGREREIGSIRSQREEPGQWFSQKLLEKICASFNIVKPVLSFGGGEPLLHPDIIDMVAFAKKKGFTCTLTTNGTLLEKNAAGLVEAGLDSLVISIDGPGDIHDLTRGVKGTFAKAKAGAQKFLELQKGKGKKKPILRINCTINSKNFHLLSRMIEVAGEFGAESLIFSHLWYWDGAIVERHNLSLGHFCPVVEQNTHELNLIKPEVIARELERVKKIKPGMMVKFLPEMGPDEIRRYYTESLKPVKRYACRAPWLTSFIMPGGEVIPCLDYSYGNLNEHDFSAIWNGERARVFRKKLRKSGIFPACVRCCMLFSF